jgi:hypothetical protein
MTRYLCSALVTLKRDSNETVVNLEEIWSEGAAVEMDDAVEIGRQVELVCGETCLIATVVSAGKHEFGWRMELKFLPDSLWSPELFRPEHMLDPNDLLGKKSTAS